MEAESHLRGITCFSTFSDTKETGSEVEYKKFRRGQPSSKTRESGLFVHERSAGEGGGRHWSIPLDGAYTNA